MSLPVASAESIAPDDLFPARTSVDYVPTEADLESLVAVNLDSFLPPTSPSATGSPRRPARSRCSTTTAAGGCEPHRRAGPAVPLPRGQ